MDEYEGGSFWEKYRENSDKRLFGLSDLAAAEEAGVLKLRRQPYPDLTGRGVLFAIADTGIEYTHPVFRYGSGGTRITAIWDQTAEGEDPQVPFGRVYDRQMIDQALNSSNPQEVVPVADPNGHGTFMAGLGAGSVIEEEGFTGMAPDAEILVVKLRDAPAARKAFWFVPEEVPAFEEDDLIAATDFMIRYAQEREKPMVIYLGVSSNQGDHDGMGRFSAYLDLIALQEGRAVVLSGGNEGNSGHHFRSRSYEGILFQEVEIRMSAIREGLYVEFWAEAPDLYGIGFVSPTGEVIQQLPGNLQLQEEISFIFEPTRIFVRYDRVEPVTGASRIQIFFQNPTDGIWKIRIFQEAVYGGRFDLWMPLTQFISGEAFFLRPDPDTTITEPANGRVSMTITAYNSTTGGIYLNSSRGYTRGERVKPDLTAPGVKILGPVRGGLYQTRSGSSVAAAIGAGIAAVMLEYNRNYTGAQIKNYFIRGAVRDARGYPNTEFGWGKINLYDTFEAMRSVN